MNSNKINTENYESFYLDYLEGNLGENDTIDLFAFLNDHPELKVEDDLLVLENEKVTLGQDFKNLLKTDIASQAISLNNIDFFLIAQKEGQLNTRQLNELNAFLIEHPQFKKDQKMYALTTVEAHTSIVYADKKNLKQRAAIILWPYYSALAAACAVLFFWLMPAGPSNLEATSAAHDLNYKIKNLPNSKVVNDDAVQVESNFDARFANNPSFNEGVVKKEEAKFNLPQKENKQMAQEEKPVQTPKNPTKLKVIENQKLDNITIAMGPDKSKSNDEKKISNQNSDYAIAMKDVARPVTRKLSDIIKSEVKVKKGTDAKGEREGIFFKIGTFEFYRNKKVRQ